MFPVATRSLWYPWMQSEWALIWLKCYHEDNLEGMKRADKAIAFNRDLLCK